VSETPKKRVLFICTRNSARSQLAEGLLNALMGDRYEAHSAGTAPTEVNPLAVKALAEIGIDISKHRAKSVQGFLGQKLDMVVTVCDHARETCPVFPGATSYLHKSFDDPSLWTGSAEQKMEKFRCLREEIKQWLQETFGKEGRSVQHRR